MSEEKSLASTAVDIAMIFLPALGYVDQYITITKTRQNKGFSLSVSLVLVMCNVLRCFFWLRSRFEMALLYQSMFMIAVQFVMLEVCVRINRKNGTSGGVTELFDLSKFWAWSTLLNFVIFSAFVVFVLALFEYAIPYSLEVYGNGLGYAALLVESSLPFPQWNRNRKVKSTEGLSKALIASWFLGDIFKTVYFVSNGSPSQFLVCAFIQLSFDVLILVQFLTYSNTSATDKK